MNPKLLLFDIDGTLISARGIHKIAMGKVLARRYSTFKYDSAYDFSGRTDPEIVENLLRYDNKEISDDLLNEILTEFCIELKKEFLINKKPLIHIGVEKLILELQANNTVFLGLVTGNIAEGARIKLESVGLYKYFPVGGFGDDSKNRNDLPPIARKRAEIHYNVNFAPADIWIIGDSVHDIYCAQKNGLRCLAVSTGWTSREELAIADPEFLEDDLSDTKKIQEILLYR